MGTNIFHAYTIKGAESETYSPKFIYHGMQYIGINLTLGSDVTWMPKASDMSMTVVRASNEHVLEASTNDELFNGIHSNVDRAIKVCRFEECFQYGLLMMRIRATCILS